MFYRATRTDGIYGNSLRDLKAWRNDPTTANLHFHALECIRALGYNMGLLGNAVQSPQNSVIPTAESRGNCLLPYCSGDSDEYMTSNTPLDRPVVQVSRVIVQYMLLFYFSMLARYETARWQTLLEGRESEDGYVYRAAMDRVAYDFVRDMVALFPNEPPRPSVSGPQRQWCNQLPSLDIWYQSPRVLMNAPTYELVVVPPLEEWDG